MKRTSNYIMQRLHSTLYSACQKITTNEDSEYAVKVTKLQWVEPHHLEVPAADKTVNWPMWKVSVRELQLIETMKTPLLMQKAIARALYALTAAYSLSFPGK